MTRSALFKRYVILVGDIALFYFALAIALTIRAGHFSVESFFVHLWPFTVILIFWLAVFYSFNLYDLSFLHNSLAFLSDTVKSLFINLGIATLFFYLNPQLEITPKTVLVLHAIFFFFLFGLFRYFANIFLGISYKKQTIGIGSIVQFEDIVGELYEKPQLGYEIKMVIDADRDHAAHAKSSETLTRTYGITILDSAMDLEHIVARDNIDTIIVEHALYESEDIVHKLYACLPYRVEIMGLSSFSENILKKIPLESTSQTWLLESIARGKKVVYESFKKISDLISAILGMVFFAAILPFVALAIVLEDGGTVFYTQTRVGINGGHFRIIKFRTMRQDAEKSGPQWAKDNDPRITKVGRILRRTRLDEFPQIINILKGDMSVVGPRAERPEYYELFIKEIPFYKERLLIKPGLTGWAQVNYPYAASLEENKRKLQYDLYYLKNKSIILDIAIIFKTVSIVLRGMGK